LTGADNKMFDQATQVAKLSMDAHKPFFGADSTSIKGGAIAGYSVDYRTVGREGAKLAARILRGESAGSIPVVLLGGGNLEVNQTSAQRLGIKLPEDVLANAKSIYK
jgi:putative tryptophan/tyrosine transport system substrate-binding protein